MANKKVPCELDYFVRGLGIFIRKRIRNNTEIDFSEKDFQKFHREIALFCIQKIKVFNSDVFENWFEVNISFHNWKSVPSPKYLELLLNDLLSVLEKSIDECYAIIPLPFAHIDKSIEIGHNCFIIAPYQNGKSFFNKSYKTPQRIGKTISYILGLGKSDKRISQELDYAKGNYSHYILRFPLLVVKQIDIFENMEYYATALAAYARNCIKLVLNFFQSENLGEIGAPADYTEVRHIFIGAKGHSPISINLPFPQNYIKRRLNRFLFPEAKNIFISLLDVWQIDTKLAQTYRRSVHFFCWEMDDYAQPHGYLSIRIQMMFTGIETLLLPFSSSGEKKRKIARVMKKLYRGKDYSPGEIESAVITLYNSRSQYIHTGSDASYKYEPHFNELGDFVADNNSLKIVRSVFSNILATFPELYKSMLENEHGLDEWTCFCKKIVVRKAKFKYLLRKLTSKIKTAFNCKWLRFHFGDAS